jgi:hypothetical protein
MLQKWHTKLTISEEVKKNNLLCQYKIIRRRSTDTLEMWKKISNDILPDAVGNSSLKYLRKIPKLHLFWWKMC